MCGIKNCVDIFAQSRSEIGGACLIVDHGLSDPESVFHQVFAPRWNIYFENFSTRREWWASSAWLKC